MRREIITIQEIEKILEKYNIGKKPLSLVLGWGEITIIRYLEGQIPDKFHSDLLLKIKDSYQEFFKYLEKNKNLITPLAYKKALSKITELKLEEDQSKVYVIAKHIIAQMEDTTPLALQKILYYIEGFSLALLDKNILLTNPEAWVHGPVYKEIYNRFSHYSYHAIAKEEFSKYKTLENFSKEEQNLIVSVIKSFGCYSGKVLELMTHQTEPWLQARGELRELDSGNYEISEDDMKIYFKKICQKYQIASVKDISRYSKKMFGRIVK